MLAEWCDHRSMGLRLILLTIGYSIARLLLCTPQQYVESYLDTSLHNASMNSHHIFPFGASSYHEGNVTQMKLYKNMLALMQRYQQDHHISKIREEALINPASICDRTFVVTYSTEANCRGGIGNQLALFLEDFMYAVIMNYTFILNTHQTDPLCAGAFTFYNWIPLAEEIHSIYGKGHCQNIWPVGAYRTGRTCNYLNRTFISSKGPKIWSQGVHHNTLFVFLTNNFTVAIEDDTRDRIHTLFPPTFYDNARFHGYGFMQLFTFNISVEVDRLVKEVLDKTLHIPNSIRISLHIRHMNPEPEDIFDDMDACYLPNIKRIRDKYPDLQCFVYLATELPQTVKYLSKALAQINCTEYHIDRETPNINQSLQKEEEYLDHGPYGKGILPMADIILLQNGDVFLGSESSTFSFMIANVLSLHALKKGFNSSPIHFGTNPYLLKDSFYKEQPKCLP